MGSALKIADVREDRSPLTATEKATKLRVESEMHRDRQQFERFHRNLLVVYVQRLYREDYPSFEHYLDAVWGIGKSHGYRLIGFAQAEEAILAAGLAGPTSEKSIRSLEGLPVEVKVKVYGNASEASGGEAPTAKAVKEALRKEAPPLARKVKPPADPIERARAAGIVPEGVDVEVSYPESPRGDTETVVEREPTPDEILAGLPERAKLSDRVRPQFDAEAKAYWSLKAARDAYKLASRAVTGPLAKAFTGNTGPWLRRHNGHFLINDPSGWRACDPCEGHGSRPILGTCPDCKGHGYYVS